MTDEFDQTLAAAFAQDLPPARDPVFCARVAEAEARRALRRDLGVMAVACLTGGALLAPFAPLLVQAVQALAPALAPTAAALAAAVILLTGEGATPPRRETP